MEILRREISRINNQIRRGMHRLQDTLSLVEKNSQNIQTNCLSVGEEVEEIYRRLNKALKDRTDYLRGEIDRYLGTELRSLNTLKDNLELEISNILSNCDLADKLMNENLDIWDDCELMDAKEIFLKTVEFIRNFEYENSDYTRKVRLILAHDPNQLVLHVSNFGDLNIANPHSHLGQSSGLLQPSGGPGLMRSKSDHRLAAQFRQQEDRGFGERGYGEDEPILGVGNSGKDRRVLVPIPGMAIDMDVGVTMGRIMTMKPSPDRNIVGSGVYKIPITILTMNNRLEVLDLTNKNMREKKLLIPKM